MPTVWVKLLVHAIRIYTLHHDSIRSVRFSASFYRHYSERFDCTRLQIGEVAGQAWSSDLSRSSHYLHCLFHHIHFCSQDINEFLCIYL